jgi:hypothetical protein
MATRAEQFHAESQRTGKSSNRTRRDRSKPGISPARRSREKAHSAKKATYALEQTASGARPSRKSTRKSANRAKPDASFNRVEEQRKGSPESRYRKARARASRTRGS